MPANGPSDDFFGASYMADPLQGQKGEYLNQLAGVHAMLTSGRQGPSALKIEGPGGQQYPMGTVQGDTGLNHPIQTYGGPTGTPGIGQPAQNAQVNNETNTRRQFSAAPPGRGAPVPPNSDGSPRPTPGRDVSSQQYDYSDTNIPPDLWNLRTQLSNWLQGQIGQGQPNYSQLPGSELFNLGNNPYMGAAASSAAGQPGMIGSMLGGMPLDFSAVNNFGNIGLGAAQGYGSNAAQAAGMYGQGALTSAAMYGGMGANALSAGMPTALNIAQTGGTNFQQLLGSLNSIQQSGNMGIQQNLADIQERYGAMGLGAGSDVMRSLGQGAAVGQAQIEAQQSSLLSNILQQGTANQLGGLNALQGIGGGLNTIGQGISGIGLGAGSLIGQTNLGAGNLVSNSAMQAGNLALQSQQSQINAILQSAGLMNTALAGQQGTFGNLAGMQQQGNMYTNQAQYQNFLRQTNQLPPGLQAALQFGTAYPGVNQMPSTGASLGAAGIAAGGSIAGGLITALMLGGAMSSRKLKENIVPVVGNVKDKLKSLPIYTWNYLGDKTKHIGPMAEDFAETFGVGDGTMLHLVDVMGVLLASQKEALV